MIYWNWTPEGMRFSPDGVYVLRADVEPTRETREQRMKQYVKRIASIGKPYDYGELKMMLDELNAYLDEKAREQ